jgi:predicted RNase H-like nuclease (RuvC/YqgF family)
MAALGPKVRARGRRIAQAVASAKVDPSADAPTVQQRLDHQRGRLDRQRHDLDQATRTIQRLQERVAELETEVQESRRLHQRVAELTDLVAEVLVPAADRDDERLRRTLEKYADSSF